MHCHIDLYERPEAVLRDVERNRLLTVAVTNLPSHFRQGLPHFAGYRMTRPSLGFHPAKVCELDYNRICEEVGLFERCVDMTSYIGEIGLDGRSEYRGCWSQQVEVFDRLLSIVRGSSRHKILSLHSTKAVADVVSRLADCDNCSSVLHWFSGTKAELQHSVDAGCWFSINTQMLRSKAGKERISSMPRARVLSESDGPFIAVGARRALPTDVGQVIHGLALLWQEPPVEVERRLEGNLRQLVSKLGR